ncbi:profilin, required for normal timing of actin polymerization in response to thermal stress [Marasmius tenuissimus]|nr:profilin, required for normal timing of actin polymerization in response to thermal stress [Marasmius tenuissimus]
MSWQAYVDTNLVGSGKVSSAAIIGLQGGCWAQSPNFTLSTEEQKAIITGFQNPSSVLSGGLKLAGQKYFAINADDKTIQLKKQGDGAVLVKTTQAVLVAAYVAPIQQPEAATVAEGLGDYLRGVGY